MMRSTKFPDLDPQPQIDHNWSYPMKEILLGWSPFNIFLNHAQSYTADNFKEKMKAAL